MPLVEGAHVRDHKAGGEHRLLDGVPDGVAGVVEHHGHPAARLENAAVFREAALHRVQIVGEVLALGAVDDRLRAAGGADEVPRFDQVVEVGVVDVLAEGRICEHVVDGVVRQVDGTAITGGDRDGGALGCARERLAQTPQLAVEDVPRRYLRNLRPYIEHTTQVLIDL